MRFGKRLKERAPRRALAAPTSDYADITGRALDLPAAIRGVKNMAMAHSSTRCDDATTIHHYAQRHDGRPPPVRRVDPRRAALAGVAGRTGAGLSQPADPAGGRVHRRRHHRFRRAALVRTAAEPARTDGANGAIAAEYVAKSEPDGYTLFFTTVGAVAINPALHGNLPYDPVKDFAPVGMAVFNSTMLVVNASMKIDSARELVALARERPGAITIGVTGLGAISHLGLQLFEAAAGVKFQAVPYRGASQAVTDLLGGQLDGLFGDVPTVMAQVKAGKLKALAATSQERSAIFPDVPTFVEQGFPDTVANQWAGTLAPAGTAPAVIAKLSGAFHAALTDADVRRKLAQAGVTPSPSTPEDFARYLEQEIARWGKLIREKGIKRE
jgi:tripartite-type tricarboxylate transporter receptor subunit TctC